MVPQRLGGGGGRQSRAILQGARPALKLTWLLPECPLLRDTSSPPSLSTTMPEDFPQSPALPASRKSHGPCPLLAPPERSPAAGGPGHPLHRHILSIQNGAGTGKALTKKEQQGATCPHEQRSRARAEACTGQSPGALSLGAVASPVRASVVPSSERRVCLP